MWSIGHSNFCIHVFQESILPVVCEFIEWLGSIDGCVSAVRQSSPTKKTIVLQHVLFGDQDQRHVLAEVERELARAQRWLDRQIQDNLLELVLVDEEDHHHHHITEPTTCLLVDLVMVDKTLQILSDRRRCCSSRNQKQQPLVVHQAAVPEPNGAGSIFASAPSDDTKNTLACAWRPSKQKQKAQKRFLEMDDDDTEQPSWKRSKMVDDDVEMSSL